MHKASQNQNDQYSYTKDLCYSLEVPEWDASPENPQILSQLYLEEYDPHLDIKNLFKFMSANQICLSKIQHKSVFSYLQPPHYEWGVLETSCGTMPYEDR